MGLKAFNASAYSVGVDNLTNVIDSGGNITAQTLLVNVHANLGSVENLIITGGQSGQVLQTDGTGNLSFVNTVAGSNTQIQFNDGNVLGATSNLTFNKATDTLSVKNSINIGGADANISGANNVVANFYFGDGGYLSNITLTTPTYIENGTSNVIVTANSNVNVSVAGTSNVLVVTSNSANVTGNLSVSNNVTLGSGSGGNLINANVIQSNTFIALLSANLGNSVTSNYFIGNGSLLTGLPGGSQLVNGNSNIIVNANSNITMATNGAERLIIDTSGNVGIGTTTPSSKLEVNGSFAAIDKSFVIKHPTKENMKLRYGSLESPYHGVRLTGQGKIVDGAATIVLPGYISALVKKEGINIQITNIDHDKVLWVKAIDLTNNLFVVGGPRSLLKKTYHFYWSFTAMRKDIPDLTTEYKEN